MNTMTMLRTRVSEFFWMVILSCLSPVYHMCSFLITTMLSSALGRLVSMLVFDDIQIHWLSKYYFDVLIMMTIFPYVLKDGVMLLETHLWKHLNLDQMLWSIPSIARRGYWILQALLVVYLLGASYGLIISTFKQQILLKTSLNVHDLMGSPLESFLKFYHMTVRGADWDVNDHITEEQRASDLASHLEFVFLISCFFPVYCTVRYFKNYYKSSSSEDDSVHMRTHLWHFLWACFIHCKGETWKPQCTSYLLALIFELLETGFFILMPLILMLVVGVNGGSTSVATFALFMVLYAAVMPGLLLLMESTVLSATVYSFLSKNAQARHIATAFSIHLASFPMFIMYFRNDSEHGSNQRRDLMICVTAVAYCAYGCTKLIVVNSIHSWFTWESCKNGETGSREEIIPDTEKASPRSHVDSLQVRGMFYSIPHVELLKEKRNISCRTTHFQDEGEYMLLL